MTTARGRVRARWNRHASEELQGSEIVEEALNGVVTAERTEDRPSLQPPLCMVVCTRAWEVDLS